MHRIMDHGHNMEIEWKKWNLARSTGGPQHSIVPPKIYRQIIQLYLGKSAHMLAEVVNDVLLYQRRWWVLLWSIS